MHTRIHDLLQDEDDETMPPLIASNSPPPPMTEASNSIQQLQAQLRAVNISPTPHTTLLRICPRILVPDTNVFIDHVAEMRQLITSHLFDVCVPTVGMCEHALCVCTLLAQLSPN